MLIFPEKLLLRAEPRSLSPSGLRPSSHSAASLIQIRRLCGVFLPILFSSSFRNGNDSLRVSSSIPARGDYFQISRSTSAGMEGSSCAKSPHPFQLPLRDTYTPWSEGKLTHARKSSSLVAVFLNSPRHTMTNVPQKRSARHESAGSARLLPAVTIHTAEVFLACAHCWKLQVPFVRPANNAGSLIPAVTWRGLKDTCAHTTVSAFHIGIKGTGVRSASANYYGITKDMFSIKCTVCRTSWMNSNLSQDKNIQSEDGSKIISRPELIFVGGTFGVIKMFNLGRAAQESQWRKQVCTVAAQPTF